MENNSYLDFDEAVQFLKTTPSTMYKWLQTGKVPGHKLGRQWRFLKDELEIHLSGKGPLIQTQKEILDLENLLIQRGLSNKTKDRSRKDQKMESMNQNLAEQLIWDAYDHGTRIIHVEPHQGKYEIRYRRRKGFDHLTVVQEPTFKTLDESWRSISSPMREQNMRRLYLHRGQDEALQVRYQKIETVAGSRITLRLWNPKQDVMPLEKIAQGDTETLQTFKNWIKKKSGLIVICGATGSGKTTTVESLLKEIQAKGQVIFTVENPVEIVIDGINQVELSRNTADEFELAYERIIYSDPDVIAFGLGHVHGFEKVIVEKSLSAAMTGHLVILQWHANSCPEALEQIQKFSDQNVSSNLIGLCHQKLVPSEKGLKAIYQFQQGESLK